MSTLLEINAAALRANFRAIQAAAASADPTPRADAAVEILAVVKADAYGHGAALCAPVLAAAGARWFGVAGVEDGRLVRDALAADGLPAARVLTMCGPAPGDASALVAADLTPTLWTVNHLREFGSAAARQNGSAALPFHLEIDSGMNRQGIRPGDELAAVLAELGHQPALRLEGLFTHLSSSEVPASSVTAAQLRRFWQAIEQVRAAGYRPELLHLGNSSAVDEASTTPELLAAAAALGARPMVRPGLALYGYALPLAGEVAPRLAPTLVPVATWTTRILDLRELLPGDAVGYGATFRAAQPTRLALLAAGYADGFRREASSGVGNGWVRIGGGCAPVAGRVSMNLTAVDVTALSGVQVGDEAILLGPGVTAQDHADWSGTIPYEILCGLRGTRRLQEGS